MHGVEKDEKRHQSHLHRQKQNDDVGDQKGFPARKPEFRQPIAGHGAQQNGHEENRYRKENGVVKGIVPLQLRAEEHPDILPNAQWLWPKLKPNRFAAKASISVPHLLRRHQGMDDRKQKRHHHQKGK